MDPAANISSTAPSQTNGSAPAPGAPAPGASGTANGAVHEEKESNSKGWEAAKTLKTELEARNKELAEIKGKIEKADREKAEKQGEFQKLYEEEKTKRAVLEKSLETTLKKSALLAAGRKHGLIDDDVVNLLDLGKLSVEGDAVKGADEAMVEFAKAKPHLFAKDRTSFPTPRANPGGDGKTTFTFDMSRSPTAEQIRQMTPEQFNAWTKAKDAQNVDPLRR